VDAARRPRHRLEPVAGRVLVDPLWNRFRPTSGIEAQRVREACAEHGHLVALREDNAEDRRSFFDTGRLARSTSKAKGSPEATKRRRRGSARRSIRRWGAPLSLAARLREQDSSAVGAKRGRTDVAMP